MVVRGRGIRRRRLDGGSREGPSFSDRIDINDIRVTLGLEWGQATLLQQGRRTGFVEVGWVTTREVVYVETPSRRHPCTTRSCCVPDGTTSLDIRRIARAAVHGVHVDR